jgi:hypothetical protein
MLKAFLEHACQECNAMKHGHDWRDFIVQRAAADARERHAKVRAFIKQYRYDPEFDLRDTAEELYAEVGSIAVTLINEKIKRRVRERVRRLVGRPSRRGRFEKSSGRPFCFSREAEA